MPDGSECLVSYGALDALTTVPRLARIVHIDDTGRPYINYEGNQHGPVVARIATSEPLSQNKENEEPNVLVAFANGDQRLPIIIGTVRSTVARSKTDVTALNGNSRVVIDANKMIIEDKKEILIKCGKSFIIMSHNGDIVIKGDNILIRARRKNNIKGATVNIN